MALDYLTKRDDIDNSRIGTIGIDGKYNVLVLAALNDRIKVCVDLCCVIDYPS